MCLSRFHFLILCLVLISLSLSLSLSLSFPSQIFIGFLLFSDHFLTPHNNHHIAYQNVVGYRVYFQAHGYLKASLKSHSWLSWWKAKGLRFFLQVQPPQVKIHHHSSTLFLSWHVIIQRNTCT